MAANMLEVFEAAMNEGNGKADIHQVSAPPNSSNNGAVLTVNDVWKEYPTPTEPLIVLRGVSFQIAPGETLAIVGPSGSGKSTLLNILGTLDRPTRGSIRLGDVDPFAMPGGELACYRSGKIGFIFQDHHLLPQCTALENVLVAKLAEGRVVKTDIQRAEELLGMVGLADRGQTFAQRTIRRRAAAGRDQPMRLMNHPAVLLCDEPTGNLDTKNSPGNRRTAPAAGIAKTHAILITVTHSPTLAAMFGRQMRMMDGVLSEYSPETAPEAMAAAT